MGCEAPKDDVEQIICDVHDAERRAYIDAAILDSQSSLSEERLQIEASEKVSKTVRLIGPTERNFLHSYFQIPYDSVLAVSRIMEIQEHDLNLVGNDVDGVVGHQTLQLLYTRIYSLDLNGMPTFQRERWEAYQEMIQYQPWTRWVKEKGPIGSDGKPVGEIVTLYNPVDTANKVFNRNYYLGHSGDAPIENTYINEALGGQVPNQISESGLQGKLITINGKQVILIYENGLLTLASYTSIGNTQKYGALASTTNNITRTYNFLENNDPSTLSANIDHISGASDSVRDIKNSRGGFDSDPMPYAVRIIAGEFSHAGETSGSPLSHGCSRLPMFYAKGVYEKFKQFGTITWNVSY